MTLRLLAGGMLKEDTLEGGFAQLWRAVENAFTYDAHIGAVHALHFSVRTLL